MSDKTTRTELFTAKDCTRSMYASVEGDSNAGCIAIINPEQFKFKPEYRTPENQLFRLGGGFGVSPSKIGNACFGYFCADGEECRLERYMFLGIANEEVTKYAEQLEAKWRATK